ncbi:MAG: hypothetical protein U9Q97_05210 [Acidobacteriota bacterium]|nr:hypothetical protein [Acidobacteriota bacterium]
MAVFLKKSSLVMLAGLVLCLFLVMSCRPIKEKQAFDCSLLELRENPDSGYYDAVVKVERIMLDDTLKMSFVLFTPTSSHEIADLSFMEDGQDPDCLEAGDVFTVPLHKPDWRFHIKGQNDIYCSLNFWEMLPVDDQWHPTKSEAMEVAWNIEVNLVGGLPKPVIKNLPGEWRMVNERIPDMDEPCGYVIYQKVRAEEVKEEVYIQYCYLDESEIQRLSSVTETEFLTGWTDWAKKHGSPEIIAGYNAVYWDMQETDKFDWVFRYAYIDSEMVIEVDIDADPLEWVKTEQEKILEGKAKKVFLRYGYAPAGDPGLQVMIEIWMNGQGTFHKRSKEGVIVNKVFSLDNRELEEIQISISSSRFRELHSRSGVPGGTTSFLSVRYGDQFHTVELKNVTIPLFQKIEQTIKDIVLPKVDETE